MKRLTWPIIVVLCLGGICIGQANGQITKQQFMELGDSLTGQWVMEDRLPIDVEKIGKAGDVLTNRKTTEWISNRTALLEKRVYQCNGKVVLEGTALTAWVGPSKQVETAYFDSLGGNYRFIWTKEGKNWVLRFRGVFGDGLKNSGTSKMTFSADGKVIECQDTELVYGDKRLPDRKTTFRRVQKTPTETKQTALPDNIAKELEFFVGDWTVEGDVLGMALKGHWFARWSPEKHCLLIRYSATVNGEKAFGNGIMGWDSATKEVVIQMFYSFGLMENVRYKLESPGLFKGVIASTGGGEAAKAACEVRTKKPNEWTFKTSGRTSTNDVKGELSVRFVRSEVQPKKSSGN